MRSMTGFGRAEGQVGASHFTIEIKSVNHRYLDVRTRMPSFLNPIEIELTKLLRSQFERGSFDITVRHKLLASDGPKTGVVKTQFFFDEKAAESLLEGYGWLHEHHKVPFPPPPEVFAMNNKVFIPLEEGQKAEELLPEIQPIFEAALAGLRDMRENEGEKIQAMLCSGIQGLGQVADKIEILAPQQPKEIRQRLQERITKWQMASTADPERMEWEIAFYADRADFTEELDRLKCAAQQFESLLQESESSIGRKLDFITQELHRELNTLAAKTTVVEVTQLAMEGKSTIEKLRQQVQNVE